MSAMKALKESKVFLRAIAIEKAVQNGELNFQTTHFLGMKYFNRKQLHIGIISGAGTVNDDIWDAFNNKKASKEACRMPDAFHLLGERCHFCGQRIVWMFDGITFFTEDSCSVPDGKLTYHMDINIPSGEIVFGNDFRALYESDLPIDHDGYLRYDGPYGNMDVFNAWKHTGMAHGYIGNSMPGVYVVKNKIIIGNNVDDNDKCYGQIYTDLWWWYSISDKDDFISRGGHLRDEMIAFSIQVVPGLYRVSHFYEPNKSQKIFASIEKIDHKI